jgi:hypothetical protein
MKKVLFLYILGVLTGCSSPVIQPKELIKSTKPVESIKTIDSNIVTTTENKAKVIESNKESLNPLPIVKNEPKQSTTNTISNSSTTKDVIISNPSTEKTSSSGGGSSSTPTPKFDVARPVYEGIRNAHIALFFKDSFKVRIGSIEKKMFKSLINTDVSNVNKLFQEYKVSTIEPHEGALGKTEDELEKEEKASEALYKSDYPNKASIYYIYAENINVKEFIDKLRQDSIVLSANENSG